MTGPLVITHSDIHNFLACRRRWHWDFTDDYRKPDSLFGNLALGTRVHAALEHYYRGLGDPLAHYESLVSADHAVLEADPDSPPWALDTFYKDVVIGRHSVTAHQRWLEDSGADELLDVEAVEQTVEAPLLDGKVLLRGKVDVLFRRRDNGFLAVNDLKTDGGRPGVLNYLERSWQHHVYLIALRLSRPEEIVHEAHYTVIRKLARPSRATSDHVVRHKVPGTSRSAVAKKAQLEQILSNMLATREAIAIDFSAAYPSPNQECQWCIFKGPCEVADESLSPTAAYEMLDRLYVRGGRHARYEP